MAISASPVTVTPRPRRPRELRSCVISSGDGYVRSSNGLSSSRGAAPGRLANPPPTRPDRLLAQHRHRRRLLPGYIRKAARRRPTLMSNARGEKSFNGLRPTRPFLLFHSSYRPIGNQAGRWQNPRLPRLVITRSATHLRPSREEEALLPETARKQPASARERPRERRVRLARKGPRAQQRGRRRRWRWRSRMASPINMYSTFNGRAS